MSLVALAVLRVPAAAAAPGVFRDCPDCPPMRRLPAGSFMMGASPEVEARLGGPPSSRGRSQPVHRVTFARPFAIGEYPVTVGQFRRFVQATGYDAGDTCYTQHRVDGHTVYEAARGYSWRDPGFPQGDDHPVVCVSWDDAMAYAAWLSRKTGHIYSLPNQSEYEYALRSGTTTAFFWGDGLADHDDTACRWANVGDLDYGRALGHLESGRKYLFQCSDGWVFTSPVGRFKPNPFGLYDMVGNVFEHLEDCWTPTHAGAPADGSTRKDGDCNAHPVMGGADVTFIAYSGARHVRDNDYRGHTYGFRVVRR
jgi:formylglycine-generating enzyme required for sulfatase activity